MSIPKSSTIPLSRRSFLQAAGIAGGMLLLAACAPAAAPSSQAPAEGSSAQAPSADAVTISMWTHDQLYVQFFTSRGEKWQATQSDRTFTFDFQQIPYAEVFTKVLANLAAGSGAPDLVGIEISVFSRFMKGNIAESGLVPFNDLIGDEKDKFLRWDPYTFNGNLYGVESALCPVGYWYQPALFEQAGVEPPKTWEEYLVVAATLKEAGAAMFPIDDLGAGLFNELLQQRGGHLFSEEGEVTLNTPEAVEVLQLLVDGANQDEFIFKTGADSFWGAATMAAYRDGLVAGAIMPDWYQGATLAPSLEDMTGQWRIATMPVWSAGGHKTSTWGGTGFAITKQSQHVEEVWDLLHFTYLTKEGQVERFKEIGYCGGQKVGAVFAEVAEDIPTQFQSPFWEEAQMALANQLTLAFAGDSTPEAAIQQATDDIQAIVAKGA
jgi:multiple sugar transport system substrate-binding protein/arabinosaccharide transport system substrate-binding protein